MIGFWPPKFLKQFALTSHCVTKLWGYEIWLSNTDKYCAKFLVLKPGYECSLHYHPIKQETFLVLKGKVNLEIVTWLSYPAYGTISKTEVLNPGQSYDIKPGVRHRFSSPKGALILEVSTHHDDSDVIRIEESRKI